MTRADYMTAAQQKALGSAPRSHQNCLRLLKEANLPPVMRPGKTAKDKAKKHG